MAPLSTELTGVLKACSQCKQLTKTFTCIQCSNFLFCNECWSKWMLHLPGNTGYDGKPHEKADPDIITRLRRTLESTKSGPEMAQQFEADDETTWFGVAQDTRNGEIFEDHGRFAALVSDDYADYPRERYPQLVSFVGETGAGKSTLIKILIERALDSDNRIDIKFDTPVTSPPNNDRIPTTGDVHLYADPSTFFGEYPRLYADCEGFGGGEIIPRGLIHREQGTGGASAVRPLRPSQNRSSFHIEAKKKLQKSRHSSQRYIAWSGPNPSKKREFSVSHLYPRLLYTFSDTVVFVLRNPRTFETSILPNLLEWGAACIDKSVNQPTLPHAILVFNATGDVDSKEWDVDHATSMLMETIEKAIYRVPKIKELAEVWGRVGRSIHSTRDLLRCYYASVNVVRIPAAGRYMLIEEQVSKLYDLIDRRCEESQLSKRRMRMLATAEKLQIFLQAAFDHFAKNIDVPFDFIKEALNHNPIPRDLGGSILKLALLVSKESRDLSVSSSAAEIFRSMTPMVASCIALDSARQNLLGLPEDLLKKAFFAHCVSGLQTFSDLFWPCSFTNNRGQCCNLRSGHGEKGHQNSSGRTIAPGSYESDFEPQKFQDEWFHMIRNNLQEIEAELYHERVMGSPSSEVKLRSSLHLRTMREFYSRIGNAKNFHNHETCLSCLRELPEHPMPCGHVLCSACVHSFGTKTSPTVVELSSCPMHQDEKAWDPPWEVKFKPRHAGVRILCLDGGGVRGIVSLHVLKKLQNILGPGLPLNLFFDLIVGTSTGGIISLGLGVSGWSVDNCIALFRDMCCTAFTPRELHRFPVLGKITSLSHGSKYKTKPFNALLQHTFEERLLFGGLSEIEMASRVAITSTTYVKHHPVVMANYNRPDPENNPPSYHFYRAPNPETEMKIWEAARATSAAPPFFKPFQKEETKERFIDGALYHNCPVWAAHQEMKLIWDDVGDCLPDILLSVGTGCNGEEDDLVKNQNTKETKRLDSLPYRMIKTVSDRMEDALNCRRIWDKFLSEHATVSPRGQSKSQSRYIRINPNLCQPVPKLDDVSKLEALEDASTVYSNKNQRKLEEIAHRLIASTFYFEREPRSVRDDDNGFSCNGRILCKLADKSPEMKALGQFLKNSMYGEFEPHFLVHEEGVSKYDYMVPLFNTDTATAAGSVYRNSVIDDMRRKGMFLMESIVIRASNELASIRISLYIQGSSSSGDSTLCYLPISGFPRELMREERDQGLVEGTDLRRRKSAQKSKKSRFGNNKPTDGGTLRRDHLHPLDEPLTPDWYFSPDSVRVSGQSSPISGLAAEGVKLPFRTSGENPIFEMEG